MTRLALDLVLDSIDATCKQLAGLSPLKDLSPMRHAAECSAPALFTQARSDRIIALKHVEALANRYGGSRKLAIVDGTHSSPRNGAARQFVARYLKKHVRLPEDAAVADGAARDRALGELRRDAEKAKEAAEALARDKAAATWEKDALAEDAGAARAESHVHSYTHHRQVTTVLTCLFDTSR